MQNGVAAIAWVILTLATGTMASARDATGKAPPVLFPNDARLARAITVRAGHVYLGELLEELSREAGVNLSVEDTRGPVSGIQLTVFVKDVPLREAMAGLTELLTHRFNRWEWQPSRGEKKGYILRCQRSSQDAAAAARAEILQQWTADVRTTHTIAGLPDRERSARVQGRSDLFPPGAVDWESMNLLGELTAHQLDALLAGRDVALDRGNLSPRGRATYDRVLANWTRPTVIGSEPPRADVGFHITWDPRFTGPVLWRRVGNESDNTVGGALWDSRWLTNVGGGWRDKRDTEVIAFAGRMTGNDVSVGMRGPSATMPEWIRRAAAKQPLNILVDPVFPQYGRAYGTWIGRNAEQTVFAMVFYGHVAKRLKDLYLLREVSATIHPRNHLIAWPQVKQLRAAAERNGGYLDFPQMLALAELKSDQLAGLAEEFPDANPETLEAWRPILQFFLNLDGAAQARARNETGLAIRDAGLMARHALEAAPIQSNVSGLQFLAQHGRDATVSLRVEHSREGGRQLVWEIRAPGVTSYRATLVQKPRHPLTDGIERNSEDRAHGSATGRREAPRRGF